MRILDTYSKPQSLLWEPINTFLPRFPSWYLASWRNSKFTPASQSGTIIVETEDAEDTEHTESSQETNTARNTWPLKHWLGEQDGTASQEASSETISREQRARISRISKGQVDEHALGDDEHTAQGSRTTQSAKHVSTLAYSVPSYPPVPPNSRR